MVKKIKHKKIVHKLFFKFFFLNSSDGLNLARAYLDLVRFPYSDQLKAKICDIFHSRFYCEQVLYRTNQQIQGY